MTSVAQLSSLSVLNASGVFSLDEIGYLQSMEVIPSPNGVIVWAYNPNLFSVNARYGVNAATHWAFQLSDRSWSRVSAGYSSYVYPMVFAIDENGIGYTCGSTSNSSLGRTWNTAAPATSLNPITVVGTNKWVVLKPGGYSNGFGIQDDGSLWSWGVGSSYALGTGATATVTTPTRVGTGNLWTDIVCAASSYAAYGIQSDGTLWSWGPNTNYVTGQGTASGSTTTPTRVGTSTDWLGAKISINSSQGLAVKANGTLWAIGQKTNYSNGSGTNSGSFTTWTQIGTETTWQQACVGYSNYVGIACKTDGTVWYAGQKDRAIGGTAATYATTWTLLGTFPGGVKQLDAHGGNAALLNLILTNNGELWGFGMASDIPYGLPGYAPGQTYMGLTQIAQVPAAARLAASQGVATINW